MSSESFFAGAKRARGYAEPPTDSSPSGPIVAANPPTGGWAERVTVDADPYAVLAQTPPVPAGPPPSAPMAPPPAAASWSGASVRPAKIGRFARRGRPGEEALGVARAAILSASWTRSVNILVTNPKGGSGKTPVALLLAGILGDIRSGYVAVWEATETAGTLLRRSEGVPRAGLNELAGKADSVRGVGQLGGYMAAQSSHVDVLGSTAARLPLAAAEVLAVRRLLDVHYRITITDSGNQLTHSSYGIALRTADAAVLPCRISLDDLAGVEATLAVLQTPAYGAPAGLAQRSVVLLTHDGGPESGAVDTHVRARLSDLGVIIAEVPYDAAIREGGVLSPYALTNPSRHAWTLAAATVVGCLLAAPDVDLVAALSQPHPATTATPDEKSVQ